ncbi:hypothetical protein IKG07_02755 [Candidatus Saccharibacteria bacterium]|nr:hypothetical protein [Candidatus Saccharibacteria bacterium]
MPRKLISISTLILLALLAGAPPAQALTIDGKEYWTLEETPKEELIEYYFLVTALNPSNSTARVLFNDESATQWMPWVEEKDVFKDLHLFWWENGPTKYDYFDPTDPEFHRIFDRVAKPGENWLSANKEVEISIPRETFEILKTKPLYYYAISEMSTVVGQRDFRSCLSDIEGKEGYECSIIVGKTGGIEYYPTEIKQAPVPEATSEFTPVATSIPAASPTPEIKELKPVITEKISTSVMRVPTSTTEVAQNSVPETPVNETPKETVEIPLAAGKKEKHEFPWWLVIFIFSGIFLILWWFIPIRRKKDEKNS